MGGVVGAIAGPIGAIGGSLIGGPLGGAIGGSLGQGIGGALTSSNAANTQAQGATSAAQIAANSQMAGLQFIAGQEQPYNQAGQQALQRYEQLLGLTGGGTGALGGGGHGPALRPGQQSGFDLSSFLSNTPGYQFELGQGLNAIENSAAARGGALSGNTLQGEMQFGQGLASQQFQQYMQQLAGLTGIGQAAASGVATAGGNLIPGAGASLASGVNAAAQYGAAGQIGAFNQLSSAFNSPSIQGGLQQLFNPGQLALSSGFPSAGGDIGSLSQAIIDSGALP